MTSIPCASEASADRRTSRRLQRKRTAGWTMPPGARYVGRGTMLGNPFRVYQHCPGPDGDWGVEDTGRFCAPMGHGWVSKAGAAAFAVQAYLRQFNEVFPPRSPARHAVLADLAFQDLVCWCPLGDPCHADVLLELAAAEINDDLSPNWE